MSLRPVVQQVREPLKFIAGEKMRVNLMNSFARSCCAV